MAINNTAATLDTIGIGVAEKTINLRTPEQEAALKEYQQQRLSKLEMQAKYKKTNIVDSIGVSIAQDAEGDQVQSQKTSKEAIASNPQEVKVGLFKKIFS